MVAAGSVGGEATNNKGVRAEERGEQGCRCEGRLHAKREVGVAAVLYTKRARDTCVVRRQYF